MSWYWHPEQNAWQFFNDPAHPELSTVRRIDWWTANVPGSSSSPTSCTVSGRHRFPDGRRVEVGLLRVLEGERAPPHRLAREGRHAARSSPAPGANPFTQTIVRPPTFADAIVALEGTIGKGYPFDPDPAVPGFKKLFDDVGDKGANFVFSRPTAGPARPPTRAARSATRSSAPSTCSVSAAVERQAPVESSEESPFETEVEVG